MVEVTPEKRLFEFPRMSSVSAMCCGIYLAGSVAYKEGKDDRKFQVP